MALYQVNAHGLEPLASTSFQEEKIWERRDLQRLLKNQIGVIADDIMVVAEEFGEWEGSGRRIDLLGVDKDANLVVVELKRTDDGGHMELQAIRYAAMISNMTWEQMKNAFKKFLQDNHADFEDAEKKLCEFFGWEEPQEEDFAQNVRIILASANFSKEITTSVLWLNERDLDIVCMRLSLHKLDSQLILSAEQIIPLPEAESYQIEVKQKKREERISKVSVKDHSIYSISHKQEIFRSGFKKADIAFFTVKLLEQSNLITLDVFNYLREDYSAANRLLKTPDEMTESEKNYMRYRFNREPEFVFEGQGYYIVRNWGVSNTPKFIEKMESKFHDLKYSRIT